MSLGSSRELNHLVRPVRVLAGVAVGADLDAGSLVSIFTEFSEREFLQQRDDDRA